MRKKKSILFYFDNYHLISSLPDEQLGILFRALMECGELEADGRDSSPILKRYRPFMSDKTQMAFAFMSDTLRRDAETYSEKCANYRSAALRREEERRSAHAPADSPRPAAPAADSRPAPASYRPAYNRAAQMQAGAEDGAIASARAMMKEKREAARRAASSDCQKT